ncbi:MAG: lysophospholipid acyltransferase family protein [Janthinobacterium lividum]
MAFSRGQRVLLAVVPPLAAAVLRLLCATLRFDEVDAPGARPADRFPKEPALYVFWHRALLLAAYRYRGLGIRILISASFDGELIARLVERLGFVAIRGSSSRGGAAGLLALTRARQAGYKVAITADGPRGPMYVAKAGAAAVVQHTGSAASCFHLHAQRAWLLRSWDRFMIPKPFSRVRVSWSAPLAIARQENATALLQASLDNAVQQAEACASLK